MRRPSPERARSVTLPREWMWWDEVQALSMDARWHFLALLSHCADCQCYDGTMTRNRARNLAENIDRKDETLDELIAAGFIRVNGNMLEIVEVGLYMPDKPVQDRASSHLLYRLFDADGNLLYVGRTWNIKQRLQEHARVQPWWGEVASHTVEKCGSFGILCTKEATAICNEDPRYNSVRHESRASKIA